MGTYTMFMEFKTALNTSKNWFAIPYTLNMSSTSSTSNEQDLFVGKKFFVHDDKKDVYVKGKLITPFDILIGAVLKLQPVGVENGHFEISKRDKHRLSLKCPIVVRASRNIIKNSESNSNFISEVLPKCDFCVSASFNDNNDFCIIKMCNLQHSCVSNQSCINGRLRKPYIKAHLKSGNSTVLKHLIPPAGGTNAYKVCYSFVTRVDVDTF